jgi:ribosomal-protein-alanine N-acetyltransferase
MPEIRSLEPDDFPNLLVIEAECFQDGYSPYFLKMIPLLYSNTAFIAMKGRQALGYVAAALEQGNPRRAWILSLAVRPQHRGAGLGEKLMVQALNALARTGVAEVKLSVATNNKGAVALYEKLGFETSKSIKDFFGFGKHRELMVKMLTD